MIRVPAPMDDPAEKTDCPDLETLEQWQLGDLGEARRGAIEGHVAHCPYCRDAIGMVDRHARLLDRIASAVDGPETVLAPVITHPDIAGYTIESEIFRGGQGVVFAARCDATSVPVAIKILLHGRYASPRELARFKREIALVSRVRHPSIVAVIDRGVTDDGRLFLVMEHVEGTSLDRALDGPAWTRGRIIGLFAGICDAVEAAHRVGIIHRDIKPANILVDADDRPHLLDFGLATSREIIQGGDGRVTRTGAFFGSLAYTAPEQLRGDRALIDARTDVYALGAVFYESLTGSLPHPVDGGPLAVLERLRQQRVPRPSDVQPAVEGPLDTIVTKALSPEPKLRYASAGAMADDLRRLGSGAPIVARPARAVDHLRRFARRNPALAGTIVTAFILLVAALGVTSSLLVRAVRAEHAASAERLESARESARASAYGRYLERMLTSVDPGSAPNHDITVLRDMLDEFAARAETELADVPDVRASVETTLGEVYASLGLHAPAVRTLESARRALAAAAAPPDDLWPRTLLQLASSLHYLSRGEASDAAALEAIERLTASRGPDHADVGDAELMLARLQVESGRAEVGASARKLAEHGLAVLEAAYGADDRRTLDGLTDYGRVLLETGDLDGAERAWRAVHAQRAAASGNDPEIQATDALQLGRLLVRRQRYDDAESFLVQGLAMRRQLLGPRHLALAWPQSYLARVRSHQGRHAEAEALAREALAVYREQMAVDDPQVLDARGDLAGILLAAGRTDEAVAILQEIVPELRAALGPDNERVRTQEDRLCQAAGNG